MNSQDLVLKALDLALGALMEQIEAPVIVLNSSELVFDAKP